MCFWLTYNLQRVDNPNAFQLRFYCREPLVRFGIVGCAIGFLGLALLYLSGVHIAPGTSEKRGGEHHFLWNKLLPQSYPDVVLASGFLPNSAQNVLTAHAEQLEKDGDPPLPSRTPVRSLVGMAGRAVLVLVGAPLFLLFLLANTQGEFLATLMKKRRQRQ